MPRFLLFLSPSPQREALGPAEIQRRTLDFAEWIAAGLRRGTIWSGARLESRSARLTRAGEVTTALIEEPPAAGAASSFFVVEAENLESALALAAACPGADPGSIQVFQLDPEAAVGEALRSNPYA